HTTEHPRAAPTPYVTSAGRDGPVSAASPTVRAGVVVVATQSRRRSRGRCPFHANAEAGELLELAPVDAPGLLPVARSADRTGRALRQREVELRVELLSRGLKPRAQPFGEGFVEQRRGSGEHDEVPGFGDEDSALVGRS